MACATPHFASHWLLVIIQWPRSSWAPKTPPPSVPQSPHCGRQPGSVSDAVEVEFFFVVERCFPVLSSGCWVNSLRSSFLLALALLLPRTRRSISALTFVTLSLSLPLSPAVAGTLTIYIDIYTYTIPSSFYHVNTLADTLSSPTFGSNA